MDEITGSVCRVHETDAVDRMMLPGSSSSGSFSRPLDAWISHSSFGRNHTRPENESSGPKSKSHRFWSGSRPLKTEPSTVHGPESTAAVTTPNETCVESNV